MHGSLDLLVGIQHHLPSGVIHQSHWQTKVQLSLFSFLQFSAQQALPQPMEFSLAHGALEAEQETIIVVSRIIDAFFVNDERVGEGANLQQVIPVATGAGQARDFQTQDRSAMLESDFSDERLKAIAPNGG